MARKQSIHSAQLQSPRTTDASGKDILARASSQSIANRQGLQRTIAKAFKRTLEAGRRINEALSSRVLRHHRACRKWTAAIRRLRKLGSHPTRWHERVSISQPEVISPLDSAKLNLLPSIRLNTSDSALRQAKIPTESTIGTDRLRRDLPLLARDADDAFHRDLRKALKSHANDAVMQLAIGSALGAFKSPSLFNQTLAAASAGELPTHTISALASAVQPIHTKTMWNWLLEHQAHLNV